MLRLQLRYIVRKFGMVLNEYQMFLYAVGIGFFVGYDTDLFYFFLGLAVLTTVLRLCNMRRHRNGSGNVCK